MKSKKPLTDRAIRGLGPPPPGKRRIVWDAIVPGLGLRVTDRGAKSFVLVTRYPGSSSPAPRSLGTYGAISLEAARIKAREWLELIGSGIDPETHATERAAQTLKAIATEYLARKAKDHRSRNWVEGVLVRHIYPTLGNRAIASIGRGDIVRLLDRIEGSVMANRTLGILTRIMNWHATRSDTFRSPIVRGMARAEQARERVLTDDEIRAIWKATEPNPLMPLTPHTPPPVAGSPVASNTARVFASLVRFILLTATRRSEAGDAKRSEIIGVEWTIPASRYKTKHDHVVPLSSAAQAAIPAGASDWLFTLNGVVPIGGYSLSKSVLDKASGVTGWTLHDLRRTARSLMSRASVPSDHAERCLGHVIGGVRGTYDRHEYFEEKARAFELLAAQIERIVRPQENVVPLGRKR